MEKKRYDVVVTADANDAWRLGQPILRSSSGYRCWRNKCTCYWQILTTFWFMTAPRAATLARPAAVPHVRQEPAQNSETQAKAERRAARSSADARARCRDVRALRTWPRDKRGSSEGTCSVGRTMRRSRAAIGASHCAVEAREPERAPVVRARPRGAPVRR